MKSIVLHFLASLSCYWFALGLMQGVVQEFISFADPINEMAMCLMAMMMGGLFLIIAVTDLRKLINSKK